VLRQTAFSAGLTDEEIGIISPICHDRRYREGDELFSETSNGSELYIIRKGIVAIEVALPNRADKRSERLTTATSGMIVGDLALVDGSPRTKTFKENQLDL
jgi:CRP-like cAMP-binding protein